MNNSNAKTRFSLVKLMIDDFFKHQKLSMLLVILIIGSAFSVLLVTQQTRKQLFEKEQLILERDVLESEWRNLIIEENVLAEPKRIEQKANTLGMQYVSSKNETVIVIKNK
ncbi:cell division protein FtsL [Orbus hercynius]|uniref:Cell division protein FtsL n=1 Tax=Orbus hercynius TaxID=593135 RepID=A0A495RHD0_9GAMM|nr:cell division protein FtsL [Orbus hercynius]RKS86937.1 cell division protein FtsL [Orbus hercynius]